MTHKTCNMLTPVITPLLFQQLGAEMVDKQKLTSAVNYLVTAPNYSRLINEITNIIERWDEHPMAYTGKLEMLNALLDVGLTNRDAFEKLLKLVEEKRRLVPATKRVDYQRNLMRQRRARIAKALELAELNGSPMSVKERKEQEKALLARWAAARTEFITSKGKLDWKSRNAASNEFWEMIDRQLDINLEAARRKRKSA